MERFPLDSHFDCELLAARITLRQCQLNQKKSKAEFPGKAYLCRTCAQKDRTQETVPAPQPQVKGLPSALCDWLAKISTTKRKASPTVSKHETNQKGPLSTAFPDFEPQQPALAIKAVHETQPAEPAQGRETMAGKEKQTCPTCKRPDLTLITADKCGRCHDRIKKGKDPITGEPITGEPVRQTAGASEVSAAVIAEVTGNLVALGYSKSTVDEVLKQIKVPANATVGLLIRVARGYLKKVDKPADPPPPPAPDVPEPASETQLPAPPPAEPEQDPISLAFDGGDQEMLRMLQESAHYHRRSLQAEILFRLDRSLDLRRAAIALRVGHE